MWHIIFHPPVLWCCWLDDSKGIQPVKTSASKPFGMVVIVTGWDVAVSTLPMSKEFSACDDTQLGMTGDWESGGGNRLTQVYLTSTNGMRWPYASCSLTRWQQFSAWNDVNHHHLETIRSDRKSDFFNWCKFTWRKFPPIFIPIQFETTYP